MQQEYFKWLNVYLFICPAAVVRDMQEMFWHRLSEIPSLWFTKQLVGHMGLNQYL